MSKKWIGKYGEYKYHQAHSARELEGEIRDVEVEILNVSFLEDNEASFEIFLTCKLGKSSKTWRGSTYIRMRSTD